MRNNNNLLRQYSFFVFAVFILSLLLLNRPDPKVPYSVFLQYLNQDIVEVINIIENNRGVIVFKLKGQNTPLKTLAPSPEMLSYSLMQRVGKAGGPIVSVIPDRISPIFRLINFLFVAVFNLTIFYLFYNTFLMRGEGKEMATVGKEYDPLDTKNLITFKDVAGLQNAKQELKQIVDCLRYPSKYYEIGAKTPRGVIIYGAPGVGKTLLARAVAGEAGVNFLYVSGSEFSSPYVAVGRIKVSRIFSYARKKAPCIIFIDEIDSVAAKRHIYYGHSDKDLTVNQLLNEMDGFNPNDGVLVFASTNRYDILDEAFIRPGRFDKKIFVTMPTLKEREELVTLYSKKVKIDASIDLSYLPKITYGFSGADIANLMNESALIACSRKESFITKQDVDEAFQKIALGGSVNKSLTLTEQDKKVTSYHESGHSIVAYLLNVCGKSPYMVTILPRGKSLGVTLLLPIEEKDQVSMTKKEMIANITTLLGGRAAEEVIYGKEGVCSGASDDIMKASHMARNMITNLGFSDKLGLVSLAYTTDVTISEYLKKTVDEEVKSIIDCCYEHAKELLTTNKTHLENMAHALMERETLTSSEIEEIMISRE